MAAARRHCGGKLKNRSIADFTPGTMTLRQALVAGWRLMTRAERRKAIGIAVLSAFAGMAELVSITAVYPLVSVLVQPTTLQTNAKLNQLWHWLGEPSASQFVSGLAAVAAVLLVAGIAVSFFAQVIANRFAAACQERFGRDLLAAFFSAPYIWFAQRNPLLMGNLFHNHVVVWSRDFIRRILTMAGQIATVALPLVLLLVYAPLLGLGVLVVAGGLTALFLAFIKRRTVKLMNAKRAADENSHVFLTEALQGIKDVKLSSREETFLKMFNHTYHISSRTTAASNSWNLVPAQVVMGLGQIGVLGAALVLFFAGTDGATLAAIMALVVLIGTRIVPAMNRFGTAVNSLSNMKPWLEVLAAVNDSLQAARASAPQPVAADAIGKPLNWRRLQLDDVSFAYPGSDACVLRKVSLEIERGGSYAFAGPSGAGKSTIIDIILGLLEPSAGRVVIDGVPLAQVGVRRWQNKIGYVPQAPLITDNSLKANIAFGVPDPRIDEDKVRACLALAHLTDVAESLPQGLDTPLGDRGHRLSGGERQRIAIARALYNDPDILVLDEATSALDTLSERAIRKALLNLSGRVTVISIAHRMTTIQDCSSIFLMDNGSLVAKGSFVDLMQQSELFRALNNVLGPRIGKAEK